MNIKTLSLFLVFFGLTLIAQVGPIFGEKCLPLAATLSPIEEISSKKTLVDPLVVKEYVK